MAKLNATWHEKYPMPAKPTVDQRVRWHVAHARACACRAIPASVVTELKRRGVRLPTRLKST